MFLDPMGLEGKIGPFGVSKVQVPSSLVFSSCKPDMSHEKNPPYFP